MAQTAAQICSLARQIAKCPKYESQSGQLLNVVLEELCQDYDFEVIRQTATGTFNTSTVSGPANQYLAGCGPNALPATFLRAQANSIVWYLQGVRYLPITYDQASFDLQVQTAGFSSYPQTGYVDMAPLSNSLPPNFYVWPPASGAYTWSVRYFPRMADITTPETSATVPWFPNQSYLITRLAGELMRITNDDRVPLFLGDSEEGGVVGAGSILRKYLQMKDNPEDKVNTVKLDRRRFGHGSWDALPNTKVVGWALAALYVLPSMLQTWVA